VKRRDFVKGLGAGTLAAGGMLHRAPVAATPKSVRWRMVTAWPPNFPIFHEGLERFTRTVAAMSDGRLSIQIFPGGQLVPPLETFTAVARGTVQMGHSASYYWAGRIPAAEIFTAIPFGMTAQEMNAWLYSGGGWELWREVYAPSGVVPLPLGNTGAQMAGWFKRRIDTVTDLRGLKMRIPGIGGRVMARAGATPVLLAGGEIYAALERGVVDAVEWVGPYFDMRLGLHEAARYYYYPGWQEPCGATELLINERAWSALSEELKTIVEVAARAESLWMLSEFETRNLQALEELRAQRRVELLELPGDVLAHLREMTKLVTAEQAEKDAVYRNVLEAHDAFQARIGAWHDIGEGAVYRKMR
jgi:TRAP-type mannitol/chloroaromatic compound transport system substrate-binding protein